jgi:orotidine-5'-phosphate decarboxylase
MSPANYKRSYGERAIKFTNPTAKLILDTMERKKTNLAVSVDVTKTHDLLAIINVVSPYVCLIKVKLLIILEYLLVILIFFFVIRDSYRHPGRL